MEVLLSGIQDSSYVSSYVGMKNAERRTYSKKISSNILMCHYNTIILCMDSIAECHLIFSRANSVIEYLVNNQLIMIYMGKQDNEKTCLTRPLRYKRRILRRLHARRFCAYIRQSFAILYETKVSQIKFLLYTSYVCLHWKHKSEFFFLFPLYIYTDFIRAIV